LDRRKSRSRAGPASIRIPNSEFRDRIGGAAVNIDVLSIQPCLSRHERCYICEKDITCCHIDRDFGFAYVCMECSGFVVIAECLLIQLGFSQPSAPLKKAGTQENP
jgi:hypothetical protein